MKILNTFTLFVRFWSVHFPVVGFDGVHFAWPSLTLRHPSILSSPHNHHCKFECILFWSLNTSRQFRGICVLFWSSGLPVLAAGFGFLFVLFRFTRALYILQRLALCRLTQYKLGTRQCAKYAQLPMIVVFSLELRTVPPLKRYLINQMYWPGVLDWKIIPGENLLALRL